MKVEESFDFLPFELFNSEFRQRFKENYYILFILFCHFFAFLPRPSTARELNPQPPVFTSRAHLAAACARTRTRVC